MRVASRSQRESEQAMNKHAGISEREDTILQAVYLYRYLTLEQVTRLFFARSSKNHAGAYLKHLTDMSYLCRFPLPKASRGNPSFVYAISSHGYTYLRSVGRASYGFIRQKSEPSYLHMMHTLGLNDILVTASLLPTVEPRLSLADLRPDWILKQTPLELPQGQEQGSSVIPDAVIDIRALIAGKKRRRVLWLEYDRGTEEMKQFKHKIRDLVIAATTPACTAAFGAGIIAFATTTGEKRVNQMRLWTEAELEHMQRSDEATIFLFTHVMEGSVSADLFLKPVWQTLLSDDLLPLLPL
jgi:hypothetical protein